MKVTIGLIGSAMLCATVTLASAEQGDPDVMAARAIVKEFGGKLKGEVAAGMKSGGPVPTIEICSVKAPLIAQEVSQSSGWSVARTSLKLRNPGNAPDDWERRVLEQFEARKAAGEPLAQLEYAERVGTGDRRQFRYMKAIPTEEVCLNCHASEIKPAVEEKLATLYPNDRARGFAVGDIRGAFTLSRND